MFHVERDAEVPTLPETPVPRETSERLRAYLALLMEWNRRINLIGPAPMETLWTRHIMDSWQLLPLFPPGPMADIGSGGGLPGIVLALGHQGPIHLIESDRRKAAFLLEACRRLSLSHVTVHPTRVDTIILPQLASVTARAFAPLTTLLSHAHRLLRRDGVAIFPKGQSADTELTEASRHWFMQAERFASRTEARATILRLSEIRPVTS